MKKANLNESDLLFQSNDQKDNDEKEQLYEVKPKKEPTLYSRHITLTALLSATIIALQIALSMIPVEVVTLLFIVFTASLGWKYTLPASLIFCCSHMFFGLLPDVLFPYFIYWPLLTVATHLINKKRKSEYINALLAAAMTAFFQFLTALFAKIFIGTSIIGYYMTGMIWFAVVIVSNYLLVLFLFPILTKVLDRLKKSYGY